MIRLLPAVLTIACFCPLLPAQKGDRRNTEMPEVWRTMKVPDASPRSPAEALKSFRIDPAFRIELVAAEPLIGDPVAIRWDADGRLWVVEMRGYMPDVDGKGEDARVGRVVVLEDTDHDGKMDRSTVFLDQLQMPRAISMVAGGVLVAEPPTLWYCQDTDGDLKCDKKTKVGEYAKLGPVEHTENGLLPALDNWIYSAKSSRRFRFADGKLIEENTLGRGQWGIAQDDRGRLYYNSNSSYLHVDLLPHEYFARNPNMPAGYGLGNGVVRDQSVWTIRVNPGINRGYEKSMLRPDGRLARTTAVSSQVIYRSNRYPDEYRGNAFVPEPGGNVVSRFVLTDFDGIVKGEKKLTPDPDWEQREFLASDDERFRPVSIACGPDGCLYVVDMYRGILQHKLYVTTFLRKQILERKLDQHIGLGRIYRIVPVKGGAEPPAPQLSRLAAPQLVEFLGHADGWHRDTAQRLLVQRRDPAAIEPLKKAACSANPYAAVHALWALSGLNAVDLPTLEKAVASKNAWVRATALRVGETLLNGPQKEAMFSLLEKSAADPESEVRVQTAFSLGQVPDELRPRTDAMLGRLLTTYGTQTAPDAQAMRSAVLSSSFRREEIILFRILAGSGFSKESAGHAAVLKDFAHSAFKSRRPDSILAVLNLAGTRADTHHWQALAILNGAVSVFQKKYAPLSLPQAPENFDQLAARESFKPQIAILRSALTWAGAEPAAAAEAVRPLTAEEQQRFDKGRVLYMAICMACHQIHGEGNIGMAPTLVGSDWVLKNDKRLTRIVLNGLIGPITVDDQEWNLVMPGLRDSPLFDDEGLASVLTYIRREWGNEGNPIDPALVKQVRSETAGRLNLWTVKELEEADQ